MWIWIGINTKVPEQSLMVLHKLIAYRLVLHQTYNWIRFKFKRNRYPQRFKTNTFVCCNSRTGSTTFSHTAQQRTCPQDRTRPPPGSRQISAHASPFLLWWSPRHLHIPKTPAVQQNHMHQTHYVSAIPKCC